MLHGPLLVTRLIPAASVPAAVTSCPVTSLTGVGGLVVPPRL